jgi:hypothetical protein
MLIQNCQSCPYYKPVLLGRGECWFRPNNENHHEPMLYIEDAVGPPPPECPLPFALGNDEDTA